MNFKHLIVASLFLSALGGFFSLAFAGALSIYAQLQNSALCAVDANPFRALSTLVVF